MKGIVKKLRSRAGESIAEVMVALLISALGMSLLVGMIGASVRVIENSTNTMHLQYAKANAELAENPTPHSIVLTPVPESAGNPISIHVEQYKMDQHTLVFYGPYNGAAVSGEGG